MHMTPKGGKEITEWSSDKKVNYVMIPMRSHMAQDLYELAENVDAYMAEMDGKRLKEKHTEKIVMKWHTDCGGIGLKGDKGNESPDEVGSSDDGGKFQKAFKKIGGGIENLAEADQRTQKALLAQAAAKKKPHL